MDKLKIRMPSLTRDRLESDYQTFFTAENTPSFNSFVCSLFLSLYRKRRRDHRERVSKICAVLGNKGDVRKAEEVIASIDTPDVSSEEMPFDYSLSLRPNKAEEIFFEEIDENGLGGATLSSYLRGLLDEYLSMFPCEREKIIHQAEYERVLGAIEEGYCLKIGRRESSSRFKPYRICSNPDKSFYYVVGLQGKSDSVSSLHLFKFRGQLIVTKERFTFDKLQKQSMDDSLSKGAAFMLDNETEAIVKLDSYGFKYMKQIYHNRPRYEVIGVTEGNEFTIVKLTGSERQIEYFVFHLAEHAYVVQPEGLSKRIARRLEMGFRHYQDEAQRATQEETATTKGG